MTNSKRIFNFLNHYKIWQFLLLAIGLHLMAPIFTDISIMMMDSSNFFYQQYDLIESFIRFIFAAFWIILVLRVERRIIYKDKTGRDYKDDSKEINGTLKEQIKYVQELDKYKHDPNSFPEEKWTDAEGIILGKHENKLIKRNSDAKGNLALFALPGGGKTTSQIIPTALRFDGSILAIDIKGDILAITKKHRNIKVFSPDDASSSAHFNLLYGLKDMAVKDRRIALEQMAAILIPKEKESYFSDGAKDFFCGIALYMIDQNPDVTFPEIVNAIVVLHNGIDWVEMIKKGSCEEAKEYTNAFFGTNEKNVMGAYQNLSKRIRAFSSGDLASILDGNGDCISPDDLENGTDIYIEIPQDKIQIYAPLTTIIIQIFMNAFLRRPDLSSGTKTKPILFLLDEFNELNFDYATLMTALATLRSKKVTLFLALQSISQLKQKYGEEQFKGIIDTCGYISLMSAQDPSNREYFQRLIGMRKIIRKSYSFNETFCQSGGQDSEEYIFNSADFNNLGDNVLVYFDGKYFIAEKCNLFNQEALALEPQLKDKAQSEDDTSSDNVLDDLMEYYNSESES